MDETVKFTPDPRNPNRMGPEDRARMTKALAEFGDQPEGGSANLTDALQSCAGSIASDAPAHQAGEGGSTPTPALQSVR